MNDDDLSGRDAPSTDSFWKTGAGLILIAFLAVGGLLLLYEHRVHVFAGNGFLLALLVLCIGMHLFMHGGHGGHASHGGRSGHGDNDENSKQGSGP